MKLLRNRISRLLLLPWWLLKQGFQYGGAAVIEGVMMRGPSNLALAVRQPNGNIALEKEEVLPLTSKHPWFKLPLIRGTFVMIDSLVIGMKALSRSANLAMDEEEEELSLVEIAITIVLATLLAVLLFIVVPTGAVHALRTSVAGVFLQNVVEGIIRIAVFLAYVWAISRMEDIDRVFMYHGAEHKAIHTYEHGEDLTVDNAQKYPTFHPRCGTSFLVVVMVISIFVFALLGDGSLAWKIGSRILVLPVVAGLGYEFIKLTARYSDTGWGQILIAPGQWLQGMTTREPDDSQMEVALKALREVLAS
ncbi:MAG: DUF1385 domain-containing protein [Syntrophomonadaceae bacterium]|nr:DUF1385 domain-containing protein [Syntrophomonadaceae bacterium]